MLLGREKELRLFSRCLDDAATGRGGALLITGEPGVGKTSLLESLRTLAEARCFRTIDVQYAAGGEQTDGAPWRTIMGHLETNTADLLTELEADQRSTSIEAVQLPVGGKYCNGSNPSQKRNNGSGPLHEIAESLTRASSRQPLLVTLDALKNIDGSCVELLNYFSLTLVTASVLVAAARRTGASSSILSSHTALPTVGGGFRSLLVHPLDRTRTGELLGHLLQRDPEPNLLDRMFQLSGGNPRLIMESESELDGITDGSVRISPGVRMAVEERLAGLSASERKVLEAASTIGQAFRVEHLPTIAKLSVREAMAGLDALKTAGLLREMALGRYRFAQGFVREVICESMSTLDRTFMHRRIARALGSNFREGQAGYHRTGAIAAHLVKSGGPRAISKALEYAELAAEQANRASDFEQAARMYTLALEAGSHLGTLDEGRRCDILISLGAAYREGADLHRAQKIFGTAAEIARRRNDRARLARIVIELPNFHWPSPGMPNTFAALLAETVLPTLDKDAGERALVAARLAAELSYFPHHGQRCEELADLALQISRTHGDGQVLLRVLSYRDALLRSPDQTQCRLENAHETIRLARQFGEATALFDGMVALIVTKLELGQHDFIDTDLEVLQQASRWANRVYYRVRMARILAGQAFRAGQAFQQGEICASEASYDEWRNPTPGTGRPPFATAQDPARIIRLLEEERWTELKDFAGRGYAVSMHPEELALLSWISLELGDKERARFLLKRSVGNIPADLRHSNGGLAAAALLAEVCLGLGDVTSDAENLDAMLSPYADRTIMAGENLELGAASYYVGKLAMALSQRQRVVRYFEAALEQNVKRGSRFYAAYSAHSLGKVLLASEDERERTRGRCLLDYALGEALNLGMKRLTALVGAALTAAKDSQASEYEKLLGEPGDEPSQRGAVESEAIPANCATPARIGTSDTVQRGIFRREDEYWVVGFEGRIVRLRHMKGMELIARLLNSPHKSVSALELGFAGDEGDLGPVLDSQAKRAYRQRIGELHQELDEARSTNDVERAERLEEELRSLTREIVRAVGLYGRERTSGSSGERARVRVTNAIRWAMARVSKEHEPLGGHLLKTIHTGTFCLYEPDYEAAPQWEF